MKTCTKRNTLSLQKFQIAKLHNLNTIIGGSKTDNSKEENQRSQSSDEWTTITTN